MLDGYFDGYLLVYLIIYIYIVKDGKICEKYIWYVFFYGVDFQVLFNEKKDRYCDFIIWKGM